MKCPFPGMDPFVELYDWQDFHSTLTTEIKRQLAPQLPNYYRLSVELIVRENKVPEEVEKPASFRPDVGVVQTGHRTETDNDDGITATLTPPTRRLMIPARKQREIRIRDTRNRRLVTAIEVLSPPNKKGLGRPSHATKLATYWAGFVNTIDIDLLRGGRYASPIEELAAEAGSDYRVVAVVPQGEQTVWEFGPLDALPTIPVPLSFDDQPVVLNLQRAFEELYAYSTYPPREAEGLEKLRPPLTVEERKGLGACL